MFICIICGEILFSFHNNGRIDVCCFPYLPVQGAERNEGNDQQGDEEDIDAQRCLHHKVGRIDMDGIPRQGDGNGKRGHQYQDILAEEQLVHVLHAGTVHLAATYFAVALADVEKRDAEQAQS